MHTRKKRVIYVHLHGSSGIVGNFGASFGRKIYPDLFSPDSDLELMPLSSDKTPKIAKENFTPLANLAKKEDQFYFQWPGGISEETRDKSADFLADKLDKMTKDDDDVEIVMLGHSYGGRIAKKVAERFAAKKPHVRHPAAEPRNVQFHLVTVAMPQIDTMPENVKTHLHFYSNNDIKDLGGEIFFRNGRIFPLIKKSEDVYFEEHIAAGKDAKSFTPPAHVKSFDITHLCGLTGCHENTMKNPASGEICKTSLPILEENIKAGVSSERAPDSPAPGKL